MLSAEEMQISRDWERRANPGVGLMKCLFNAINVL